MSFINVKELSKLIGSIRAEDALQKAAQRFSKQYQLEINFEDLLGLVQTAGKINKREKGKEGNTKAHSKIDGYQIFCFGQFKVFKWVLVLYSHHHQINLKDYTENDIDFLQNIFRVKTRLFLKYQLQEITHPKSKDSQQWDPADVELLKQIVQSFNLEAEWKAISFQLFKRTQGKTFKIFSSCREKWNNHINPKIKKADWSLAEDVELFTLVNQYGCKWALISRELKGIRSEHTVKNRYNSLVKSVRKQQRGGDSKDVNKKILHYLSQKLSKRTDFQEKLNRSSDSMDSLPSRERSREEQKCRLNTSLEQAEAQQSAQTEEKLKIEEEDCLFHGVYDQQYERNEQDDRLLIDFDYGPKEEYLALKKQKKTNDQDDQEDAVEQGFLSFEKQKGEGDSEVKTLTLQELEREYNRLMNFDSDSNEQNLCFLDEIDQLGNGYSSSRMVWMHGEEEPNLSWCSFGKE